MNNFHKSKYSTVFTIGLLFFLLACRFQTPVFLPLATPTPAPTIPPVYTATARQTSITPASVLTATPDPSPTPLNAPPLRPIPSSMDGLACFGSAGYGLACLDSSGWRTYLAESSPLEDNTILGLADCPDRRILALTDSGVNAFRSDVWSFYPFLSISHPTQIICDNRNRFWIGHYNGVSVLDGTGWKTYPAHLLSSGSANNKQITGLAVDKAGTIWVSTLYSISAFDGVEWTVYQEELGLSEEYRFTGIDVAPYQVPWGVYEAGLLKFDGFKWDSLFQTKLGPAQDLLVTGHDEAWVATYTGLYVLHGGHWTLFDRLNTGLTSNNIRQVAIDESNRLWLGTAWGVSIFSDKQWSSYHMSNSELPFNDIRHMLVTGSGPKLPRPMQKQNGGFSAQLLTDNRPLTGTVVEICVEPLGVGYYGDTPCATQPFRRQTQTDSRGHFSFEDLPVGMYVITVQINAETWVSVQAQSGAARTFSVQEGEIINYGSLQLDFAENKP